MNRAIIAPNPSGPKKAIGRRAHLIKKLEQKGKRYANKAERAGGFFKCCRFYEIADAAFVSAKRLKRLSVLQS